MLSSLWPADFGSDDRKVDLRVDQTFVDQQLAESVFKDAVQVFERLRHQERWSPLAFDGVRSICT